MKILVLNWQDIKNPFAGGAEVHMHEIFKRIVNMGHEVTIFCSSFEKAPDKEIVDGIKIIRKGNRNLFNYYVKSFYQENLKKENFDIVIDDINKIPFYTPRFVTEPLLAISHHFFGTSIFKEAGLIAGLYVYFSEKLVDYVYKKTDFAVVSDSTLNEFIERGFKKDQFTIVTNGITLSQFPLKVAEENFEPNITYFGRLKKYKSVDHILKAFAILLKEYPKLKLNIAGSGDFRPKLEELAKELKIENNIKFWGYITEEEKIGLLSKTYCVLNPSIKEGWGITNIEANACGTLVISADSPGLRDSVSVGKSGLLYDYGNIKMMAEKINSVIKNDELRSRLSNGAVEWARQFSWDDSANKMLELCEKIIEKKRASK